MRILSRTSLALFAGSATSLATAEYMGSDSGVVRSFRFWRGMMPIYLHYKYIEWKTKDVSDGETVSAHFRPLHEKYSPRVENLALSLKGFYFKLAQILSTRDDFLPDLYLEWTKKLQDKSPCVMKSSEVKGIVEKSLNIRMEDMFSEWEDEPIGAASIGQVHRARLQETGQMVAVKVQYPGIEMKFRNDIDTVEKFCKYMMPQNVGFFAEIKKQFATEFDARGEHENLKLVRENIHKAGWNKVVEVPEALFSSKEVLVMSYLEGPKLVDGVQRHFRKLAERQGRNFEEMQAEQRRMIENGEIERVDARESAATTKRLMRLMSLRDWVINCVIMVGNYTVRPLIRREKWEYQDSADFVNLGQVIDTLLKVHAHEILVDGAFNGDPHPGNILLMPDGRLGLVDYGQVKKMSIEDRVIYAKIIIALSRNDRCEVVRLMVDEVGFRTKYMKEDIIYETAVFFNCRDTEDILKGMNVSAFMEYLEKTDPIENINDEFVMVGRVSVLLRGLANAFGMKIRVSEYWKGSAERFLQSQGIEY